MHNKGTFVYVYYGNKLSFLLDPVYGQCMVNIMEHYGPLWNIMEHFGTLWKFCFLDCFS